MGADIHLYLEVNVDGTWQHRAVPKFAYSFDPERIDVGRYYNIFDILGYCCSAATVNHDGSSSYKQNNSGRSEYSLRMLPRAHEFSDCQISQVVNSKIYAGFHHSFCVLTANELLNDNFWNTRISRYKCVFVTDDIINDSDFCEADYSLDSSGNCYSIDYDPDYPDADDITLNYPDNVEMIYYRDIGPGNIGIMQACIEFAMAEVDDLSKIRFVYWFDN